MRAGETNAAIGQAGDLAHRPAKAERSLPACAEPRAVVGDEFDFVVAASGAFDPDARQIAAKEAALLARPSRRGFYHVYALILYLARFTTRRA